MTPPGWRDTNRAGVYGPRVPPDPRHSTARDLVAAAAVIAGAVIAVAGLAMLSPAAALIGVGVTLVVAGVLWGLD